MEKHETPANERLERRFLNVELRAAGTDDKPVISGTAAVFNQETVIGSWFRETIKPGAFARVLSENPDVVGAFNHNWDVVLGRTLAGTLRLLEDDQALNYEIDVNLADPQAVSVYEKVKRGDVRQSSFAFTVRTEEWTKAEKKGDLSLRTIVEIDELFDVSPVTFPAYPQTSVTARSKAEEIQGAEGTQAAPGGAEGAKARQAARTRSLQLSERTPIHLSRRGKGSHKENQK
jgi:HK97 family phage prohead protease